MAKNVIINGVTYSDVPYVEIPLASDASQTAEFYDTSDATLSSGDHMLYPYTSYANGTKFTGSIQSKSSSDLTASGATVTAPAGYYSSSATKTVSSGSTSAPSTITGTSASVSVSTGTITLSKTVSVTPTVSEGYVTAGTATDSNISLSASVTTLGETSYTPTTSNQTIAAGTYLTGVQTISGDANLIASNIKSGVSIFGVSGSLTSATISQDSTTKVLNIS